MNWKQVEEIFRRALEKNPEDRSLFLEQVCGADERLRTSVEELLESDDRAANFLETSALEEKAQALAEEGTDLTDGSYLGHRQIIRKIGSGGMGTVYEAYNTKEKRLEALKVLPSGFLDDDQRVRRFRREGKIVTALRHPGIVETYEFGESDEIPFIAMELVEGETLAERIKDGPLTTDFVIEVIRQIVEALRTAHKRGVVHRDIKASNVMVTPDRRIKLFDFGLAKVRFDQADEMIAELSSETLTMPGMTIGTINYMSPERILNQKVDRRSDIFSLGVLLYQLITGRLPFEDTTPLGTLHRICNEQPLPIARFNFEASGRLEPIVRRCLRKDPRDRFQSVDELSTALGVEIPEARRRFHWYWLLTALFLLMAVLAIIWASCR